MGRVIEITNTKMDPEDTITISKEEHKRLVALSNMLGVMSVYLEDFCITEEDTTLQALLNLLIQYHQSQADCLYYKIEELRHKSCSFS